MKSASSSLLSFVAVLLAASVFAGAAPVQARAADSLKVKTYKDTATRTTTALPQGGLDVQIRETFKLKGYLILQNMTLSQVVRKTTRVRLVQVYSYEPPLDAGGTLVPVEFSLGKCHIVRDQRVYASLSETVDFRGSQETIRDCALTFEQVGRRVVISFVLAGQHLAYAESDAGGSIVQEAHFGRYAIATMLCGEPPQSVLGQAAFTLEVRPGSRATRAVKQRIHLATDLMKTDSSALCKIVGVPWSEK
jgi:hypothetical protein